MNINAMQQGHRQTDYSIELLRILSCLAVIWLHASALQMARQTSMNSVSGWLSNSADAISRWCVPVFVMISGALLISRSDGETAFQFYQRRYTRVLVPLVFWTVFYLAFTFWGNQDLTLNTALNLIKIGKPYYHLWYLYMLAGLYLVIPFITQFVKNTSRKMILWAIVVTSGLAFISNLLNTIRNVTIASFLEYFPLYIGYFLLGYYIYIYGLPKLSKKALAAIGILCATAITILVWFLYPSMGNTSWKMMYSYQNLLVLGEALAVFMLVRKIDWSPLLAKTFFRKTVDLIAPLTLGIYLIHPLFLQLANEKGMDGMVGNPVISIPAFTLVVFILSLSLAWMMSKVPLLKVTVK